MKEKPAIEGGKPVRDSFLIFSLPMIGKEEEDEVLDSLRSGWISTGPKAKKFEEDVASYIGCKRAIALNSCTAALHISLLCKGIGKGDEVITTPLTFVATANSILHAGAKPVFVDINKDTLNIDVSKIEAAITSNTKAIIPVDLYGQPCELEPIMKIARKHNLAVIEDAAHSFGAVYHGKKIGTIADSTCFSFYPTKNITTIEGGIIATDDEEFADKVEVYSNHGLSKGAWKRYAEKGNFRWDCRYPGYKYNMTDIQASVGLHQLKRLDAFIKRRSEIYSIYKDAFEGISQITLPKEIPKINHTKHLFPILIDVDNLSIDRNQFMDALTKENIGSGIHYISVHMQSYYKRTFGFKDEDFPNASFASERLISLPLYPKMADKDVQDVITALGKIIDYYRK
jgi:dTDP-4-amino-4,6-dideoxygalactose transaminase